MVKEKNDNLVPISISEILDKHFFIPHYQRGYRWTKQQVEQLLDDINGFVPKEIPGKQEKTFYCLQPIVVKLLDETTKEKYCLEGEWYEVIDGQQRLTTIYLVIHYINDMWAGRQKKSKFNLTYETRGNCVQFLNELRINEDQKTVVINKQNIDYFHISSAYQTIRQWEIDYVQEKGKPLDDAEFQSKFFSYSKIIWYKVSEKENSQKLFERLNLGKIPLTNAELTKALFLSSESFNKLGNEEKKIKQFEIARLWDEIEQRLNEPDLEFWSFITNKKREAYDTRIELILDMISGKEDHEKDPLFTFIQFSKKQKELQLADIWLEIEQFYYTLLEWYKNREMYHKIGYLITAKPISRESMVSMDNLVKKSMEMSKEEFYGYIDDKIRDTVKFEISELRYNNHPNQIFNVLLLFNVETNRKSNAITEFYPFKQHKDNYWSLEHIHARNAEAFDKTKKDPWLKWLDLHLNILNELDGSEHPQINKDHIKIKKVIEDIMRYNNQQLTWERFASLFGNVNDLFTEDPESMDRQSEGLSNLALLSQPDNAALNNSVFELKRREIIKLDKEGNFIPVCTRRVFMKYYNEEGINTHFIYWSNQDRERYFKAIKMSLVNYLPENFTQEEDENE